MDLSKVKQKFSYKLFGIGGETELEITNEKSELKRGSRGVDYSQLRKFLKKGDWRAADEETRKVMCRVAAREKEGWLDQESIDNFPCEDLQQINQLWEHYSKGKFGFSVQKKIYENLGGGQESTALKTMGEFMDAVGWNMRELEEIYYKRKNAPQGHFPIVYGHFPIVYTRQKYQDEWAGIYGCLIVLFSRAKTCNL